jgi:hypothetical protein
MRFGDELKLNQTVGAALLREGGNVGGGATPVNAVASHSAATDLADAIAGTKPCRAGIGGNLET